MKIGILFETQTWKIALYSREKQKLRIVWTGQLYFGSVTLELSKKFSFHGLFVFRLAGHFHTAILADTI